MSAKRKKEADKTDRQQQRDSRNKETLKIKKNSKEIR